MADSAASHPDGTFSLLRGGITQVNVAKNQPIMFRGALVVRLIGSAAESGPHNFKLICVDQDGHPVGMEFKGNFSLPAHGGSGNLVANIELLLPRLGKYEFLFSVDGSQRDSWPIEAKEIQATQS